MPELLTLLLIILNLVVIVMLLLRVRSLKRELQSAGVAEREELEELRRPVARLVDLARSMRSHKSVLSMGELRQWEVRAYEVSNNEAIDVLVDQADTVFSVMTGRVKKVAVDYTDAFRPLQTEPSTISKWLRG